MLGAIDSRTEGLRLVVEELGVEELLGGLDGGEDADELSVGSHTKVVDAVALEPVANHVHGAAIGEDLSDLLELQPVAVEGRSGGWRAP